MSFFLFIPGINELHAFDNENMMIGNALEDANYQIAKDNDQMEELFGPVEEYYQQLDAEELEDLEDLEDLEVVDSFFPAFRTNLGTTLPRPLLRLEGLAMKRIFFWLCLLNNAENEFSIARICELF